MRNIFLLTFFLSVHIAFAHSIDEAYFKIYMKDAKTFVDAEFPYTIRDAVLKVYPEIENSTQQKFDEKVLKYFVANLKMYNNGNTFLIKNLKQLKGEHNHSVKYIFDFGRVDWSSLKIRNTIMFNINSNQKNFHTLQNEKLNKQFTTSKDFKTWSLKEKKKSSQKITKMKKFRRLILIIGSLLVFWLIKYLKPKS